jgi:hypothetical protein
MSDTPRTDAQVTGNCTPTQDEYEELAAFARLLERELERAKKATGFRLPDGKMLCAGDILEFDGYPCIDSADDCNLNNVAMGREPFKPSGKGVNYRYTVEWCNEEFMWTCPIWCVTDRVRGSACGMALFEMKGKPGLRVVGNMKDNPELLESDNG